MGNYRIITASSDSSEAAGIATWDTIVIHESLRRHVTQITRQSSRSIRVTVDRADSEMPIRVISTYAPHIGHAEEERRHRWEDVGELLSKKCEMRLIIWEADANGRLVHRNQEEEGDTPKKNMPTRK